ncbi:hypothetical protein CQA57_02950 [Helicobacter anseris]|uniref:ComEC/Rec2-related protein domain-containing protein n=1 Tax=Helicobacter anseris TaxID=375926 RepID=A0A3D8J976_9HELI|nr:ComEC/Rec2 family competence protein [Helicobacter anseris]RDU74067.1 hypothetical protein CQA57_02950 [Helicobacter anseris]
MSVCLESSNKRYAPLALALFDNKKQKGIFVFCCIVIFFLSLWKIYADYQTYLSNTNYEIIAQVKSQYTKIKNQREYFVLRVQDTKGYYFYITSFLDLKSLVNREIRIYGKMKQCSFFEFLKSCYFSAYNIALMPQEGFKAKLQDFIDKQHQDIRHSMLYRALFFADSLSKEYRDRVNALGIAHLVAISGFHLGILSALLFFIFQPIYGFFHKRYFTYRNRIYDLSAMVLFCMFLYLILLDFQASFLRAFVMSVFGFLLFFGNMRIFSFEMLFVIVGCILAVFPRLVFNVGFVLSVSGVFYIFLILRHFPKMPWYLWIIAFNSSIFFLMGIIVHFYFPYFSFYQYFSMVLSVLFVVFFPLMLFLHTIFLGGIFDSFLDLFLIMQFRVIEFYTPWFLLVSYVLLSFFAIFSKKCFYVLLACSICFYCYLSYLFLA